MLPEYIQKRLYLTYCTIRKWPTDLKVYPFSNNTFLTDDYRNICNGEIVSSQKYLRITCFTTIVMVEWWCKYWVGISRAWSRTKRFQWIFASKLNLFVLKILMFENSFWATSCTIFIKNITSLINIHGVLWFLIDFLFFHKTIFNKSIHVWLWINTGQNPS